MSIRSIPSSLYNKKIGCGLRNYISDTIKACSLGQYQTAYTLGKRHTHSTVVGGLVSLVVYGLLIAHAINTLRDLISEPTYYMQHQTA
jgi:hypothetical protein